MYIGHYKIKAISERHRKVSKSNKVYVVFRYGDHFVKPVM